MPPDYPVGKEVAKAADVVLPDVERWAVERPFFTFALLDGVCGWGVRTLGYTEFLTLPRSSPPVSYTHLDVYKRQELGYPLVSNVDRNIWELRTIYQGNQYRILFSIVSCLLYTSRCV